MTALVGRDRELEELRTVLADARTGRPRVVVLRGDAGIGKTSLARAIAHEAGEALWSTAIADGSAPAFWPWRTLLTTHVARTAPATLAAQIGECGAELSRLVPELRRRLPGLDLLPPPADAGRYPLFLAVARMLGAAALAAPLVVVLDDLQSADTDSLLLFDFLANEVRAGGLLLVATVRSGVAGHSPEFRRVLGALLGRPEARLLQVEGLDRRAVGRLVGTVAGHPAPPAAIEAIHRRTEGNPFFVAELVRLLTTSGSLNETGRPGAPAAIPPGVDAVVAGRLAALSEPCRTVLRTGAVIGRSFTLSLVRELTGEPEQSVLRSLEEAVATGLLREGVTDQFVFAHPLVHEVVRASIARARQTRLHRRIAELMEADPANHAELAHHWYAAGDEPERALEHTARAAAEAGASGAYAEAATLYEQALSLAGDDPALLVALGHARRAAGEIATARQAFLAAAAAARAARDAPLLARAALGLGGVWDPATVLDEELRALLAEALTGSDRLDAELRVELRARYARALEDVTLATRAVATARELGRPAPLLAALVALHCAADGLDADRRLTMTEELAALAEAIGDRERQVQAALMLARSRLEHADRAAAVGAQYRAVDGAAALRSQQYAAVPALFDLAWSFVDGRFDDVERLARSGPIAERPRDDPLGLGVANLYLVAARREQGRLAELGPLLDLAASYPNYPAVRYALPALFLGAGRAEEARAALAVEVSSETPPWGLGLMAEACVELADRPRAIELYGLLRRHAGHALVVSNALLCLGPADRPLGMLAALLGRPQDAIRHFEMALTVARRLSARPALVRTRVDLAGVLLARGRPDDRARAARLLDTTDAAELGMTALAATAERLRAAPPPTPVQETEDSTLTRRELEVLTLVARGLANKQIARALEVSDKTVKAHVSNILAKVGAADRTQAAIYAMRHGLVGS